MRSFACAYRYVHTERATQKEGACPRFRKQQRRRSPVPCARAAVIRECACPPAAAAIHACLRWTAGCTGPRLLRPHNGTMYGHSGRNRRWRVSRSLCGRADCVAAFGDAVDDTHCQWLYHIPFANGHFPRRRCGLTKCTAFPVKVPHRALVEARRCTAHACVTAWNLLRTRGSCAVPIAGCPTGMRIVLRTLSNL